MRAKSFGRSMVGMLNCVCVCVCVARGGRVAGTGYAPKINTSELLKRPAGVGPLRTPDRHLNQLAFGTSPPAALNGLF